MDSTTIAPSDEAADRAEDATGCCEATPVAPPRLGATRTAHLAGRLKALADPTRLGLLDLLARQPQPLCVCDLTPQFAQHQPTISHHLRLLRQAGLIAVTKRGVWSYYAATDEGKRCLSLVETLA